MLWCLFLFQGRNETARKWYNCLWQGHQILHHVDKPAVICGLVPETAIYLRHYLREEFLSVAVVICGGIALVTSFSFKVATINKLNWPKSAEKSPKLVRTVTMVKYNPYKDLINFQMPNMIQHVHIRFLSCLLQTPWIALRFEVVSTLKCINPPC